MGKTLAWVLKGDLLVFMLQAGPKAYDYVGTSSGHLTTGIIAGCIDALAIHRTRNGKP